MSFRLKTETIFLQTLGITVDSIINCLEDEIVNLRYSFFKERILISFNRLMMEKIEFTKEDFILFVIEDLNLMKEIDFKRIGFNNISDKINYNRFLQIYKNENNRNYNQILRNIGKHNIYDARTVYLMDKEEEDKYIQYQDDEVLKYILKNQKSYFDKYVYNRFVQTKQKMLWNLGFSLFLKRIELMSVLQFNSNYNFEVPKSVIFDLNA